MKNKNYKTNVFYIFLALLALSLAGCDDGDNGNNAHTPEEESLLGTSWKLVGVVDVETGKLEKIGTEDCKRCNGLYSPDQCYVITFSGDTWFTISLVFNTWYGVYEVNYTTHTFYVTEYFVTTVAGLCDGSILDEIYSLSVIMDVTSFSQQENELKLFYNGNKNYVLFNSL